MASPTASSPQYGGWGATTTTGTSEEGVSPSAARLRDPPRCSLLNRGVAVLCGELDLQTLETPAHAYRQPQGTTPGLCVHASENCQQALLTQINTLLQTGRGSIEEAPRGSGYSLMVYDEGGLPLALFKSEERELGTPFDQIFTRGSHITSKEGISPGQGAMREYIAMCYIRAFLERAGVPKEVCDVPDTAYVTCSSEQLCLSADGEISLVAEKGVLVAYEQGCMRCCEESIELFQALPTRLIHLVAILDMLLLNADRNGGNLLLQNGRLLLIDHAAILPAEGASSAKLTYLNWEALQQPLDEETQHLVASLSPNLLEAEEGLLATHTLALNVLQEGLRQGLSLFEIALLFADTDVISDTSRNIIAYLSHFKDVNIEEFMVQYKELICVESPTLSHREVCIQAKNDLIPVINSLS